MRADMEFELWRLPDFEIRSDVNFAQQAMRHGARTILNLEALRPVPFFDGIIEVFGLDQILRADPFDLVVGLVLDALVNEEFAPHRCGWRVHCPLAKGQEITVVSAVVPVECLQDLRWWCEQRA